MTDPRSTARCRGSNPQRGHPTAAVGVNTEMELPREMEPTDEFWPTGCSVGDVKPADCEYCEELLAELRRRENVEAGQEPATDAGDASLAAFAGGQGGEQETY